MTQIASGYINPIKRIQVGTITLGSTILTNTAVITAVDTTKAYVLHLGNTSDVTAGNDGSARTMVALTNATTVTATRGVATGGIIDVTSFVVIEYK